MGFQLQICWKYFDEEDRVKNKLKRWGGVVQTVICKRTETLITLMYWYYGGMNVWSLEWIIILKRD